MTTVMDIVEATPEAALAAAGWAQCPNDLWMDPLTGDHWDIVEAFQLMLSRQ